MRASLLRSTSLCQRPHSPPVSVTLQLEPQPGSDWYGASIETIETDLEMFLDAARATLGPPVYDVELRDWLSRILPARARGQHMVTGCTYTLDELVEMGHHVTIDHGDQRRADD